MLAAVIRWQLNALPPQSPKNAEVNSNRMRVEPLAAKLPRRGQISPSLAAGPLGRGLLARRRRLVDRKLLEFSSSLEQRRQPARPRTAPGPGLAFRTSILRRNLSAPSRGSPDLGSFLAYE